MTVTNISLSENRPRASFQVGANGQVEREYTVELIVTVDDVHQGPLSIIQEGTAWVGPIKIPLYGTSYNYNGEFDLQAYAIRIGEPIAANDCFDFLVPVTYSTEIPNNEKKPDGSPAETPEQIAREIGITFVEDETQATDWEFKGFCDGEGEHLVVRDPMGQPVLDDGKEQELLNGPVLKVGQVGPIRNSAGCARIKSVKKYRHILRITQYSSNWDCAWRLALGKWNDAPLRVIESDATDIRFDCTYDARTLQLININKRNIRKAGYLYYSLTWVLSFDPEGFEHKELDAGLQAAFVPGAKDPSQSFTSGGGATVFPIVDAADTRLARSPTGKRDILDSNGNPITSEVELNGEGVEARIPNSAAIPAPIFSRWCRKNSEHDMSTLPL